jgi:HK97 family phage portal protein
MSLFNRAPKKSRYDFEIENALPALKNSGSIASSEFVDWFTSGFQSAGQFITELTAMQVSSVYACVSLIGGAIASLPLPVYERTAESRNKVQNNIYWLLNEQPCEYYSAAIFWESMLSALLLHGDAFAEIKRKSNKVFDIKSIEWINPRFVTVVRDSEGNLLYKINDTSRSKSVYTIPASDMIHVPGPGFNGLHGMSQIKWVLRHAASISLAADKYSAAFFENGARPDFAIEVQGNPNPEQQDMMRNSWSDRYQGVEKSHKPVLLTGGAKVHELTMSAEDSQLLATRQFQVEDIARIFGVPSHMIGSSSATAWGTGIEQMSIAFVKYTLARHLTKIEQELNRKLWPVQTKYFVEFQTAGLERGDYKTRNEGYRVGLGRAGEPGWMTVNEIRKIENMPPIDGGDVLNDGLRKSESIPAGTDNAPTTATSST